MKHSKPVMVILSPFKAFGNFVAKLLLSSHLRRVFFMTFVYGLSKGSKELRVGELLKSKPILDVIGDTEALAIPAMVYGWLWESEEQEVLELGSEDQFVNSCKELIGKLPAWMCYGSIGFMVDDAARIYRDLKEQQALAGV